MQSAAPPECLVYLAHYGAAVPDAKSTNQFEQLLAEPEIVGLSQELDRLAEEAMKKIPTDDEPARLMAATLPTIGKTLLARPWMFYVASVQANPAAPDGRAGIVVAAGDRTAEFKKALSAWEEMYLTEAAFGKKVETSKEGDVELRRLPTQPGVPPVVWGVDGEYVFLTLGEGEAPALLERLHAKEAPPAWLKQLTEEAAIPRPSDLVYINLKSVMKIVDPLLPLAAAASPVDPNKIIDALGLRQLRYASAAVGLDEQTSVSKFIVGHDEDAGGLLALAEAQPLAKTDVALIPKTADFAFIGRVDADEVYRKAFDLAKSIDENSVEDWSEGEAILKQQIGLDIREDLLAALGDVWTIYNSPLEGGSLLTGACAAVSIRDRAKAEQALQRIPKAVEAANQGRSRTQVTLSSTMVGKHEIHYVQVVGTEFVVAPAWCLTDDRLIVALSPQMVRVHLSRPADAGSLADVPEVARQLAAGDVTALVFADGRGTAAFFYSYLQYAVTYAAGELLNQTGIKADLSKFPTYAAISKHLRPSVAVARRRKTVLSLESYSVGPAMAPIAPMIGAVVPMAVLGVRQARVQAVGNLENYTLRTLSTAAVSYAVEKNETLPRAIRDADGKPLLSWRVALLPQLGEKDLYDRFKLDEPWDSAHNQALIPLMPQCYVDVSLDVEAGKTVYQIPRGKGTLYEGDKTPTEAEVDALPIGRGQTVLFVAAARDRAVTWTKPDDVEIDEKNLFERLLIRPDGQFSAAMNDGSIVTLPTTTDPALVLPMFFPRTAR
jgi:hypothetical protein